MKRLILFALSLCVATTLANAQSASTAPAPIFGSKTPELIPFNVAFEAMLGVICDGPVPQPWKSRGDYMRSSGLTQEQQDTVTIAAVKYTLAVNEAGKGWREAKKAPMSSRLAQISTVSHELDLKVEELRGSLESELGPTGYARLVTFIETTVKSGLVL